jgi:hypothetical protein
MACVRLVRMRGLLVRRRLRSELSFYFENTRNAAEARRRGYELALFLHYSWNYGPACPRSR